MTNEHKPPAASELRASDRDREALVERLRVAMNEGRLSLYEWDERVALAYRANTYADLERLSADLPADPAVVEVSPAPRVKAVDGLPTALKVLWTIWLTAVLINLVVWLLVSVSNFELVYFWPIWVAGPAGAALAGVTAGTEAIRRSHRKSAARRRAEQAARKASKPGKAGKGNR